MMNGLIQNLPSSINDLDFLIKPCPINNPLSRTTDSMYKTITKIDTYNKRNKVRQRLGVPKETSVVFTAHAPWEEIIIKLDKKRKWNFYNVIPELVKSHLLKMKRHFLD